ncbi:MAG: magnesium chelatase subunit D [Halieaceae bacterium]|nr:magnesium chelatase subunit D [Halieaceae bacterium]
MDNIGESRWEDALQAAALLAVDPLGLGGVALKARPGPVRDAWLQELKALLPTTTPFRKIPQTVSEARLLGGLDLAATLKAGAPVSQTGLLTECDGGYAVLAMAERCERSTAAHLCQALDRGEVRVEREGLSAQAPAHVAVIALDESADDDEQLDPALAERLAFHIDLHLVGIRDLAALPVDTARIAAARDSAASIHCDGDSLSRLVGAAAAFGVDSPRASLFALETARAAAALDARSRVEESDLELATRLVIAPRATRIPMVEEQAEEQPPPPPEEQPEQDAEQDNDMQQGEGMQDRLIEAAQAALPAGLLARLAQAGLARRAQRAGKSGQMRRAKTRGRPMGTIAGDPRSGARLSPVATLRAAAPWQPLRQQEQPGDHPGMLIRRDDFRVVRFRERSESTTVFVVDASGSSALNRLAEAKGAVELLLADCYIRRDQVAMVAFRGEDAEVLLPPTRSLVRAKRNLAALPGGGGTPLTAAIETAAALADQLRRRGSTPAVVFLTDGRGNIARDGSRGREAAAEDLESAAALFREAGVSGMVIDTSPRPGPSAENLARSLDLTYLPLPHADANQLRDAVRAASP